MKAKNYQPFYNIRKREEDSYSSEINFISGAKHEINKSIKRQKGITLVALVIIIIIIIILSTVAINYLFGENGLITRTQQAAEMSNIESVREKLEMAKGTAVVDGKGYIDADHYFDIIYEEGIIGDRENDVKDNKDGTYEITTVEGYIFIITLLPTPEKATDIEIEYSGTAEGPRIANIDTTWTTNSISIEVEARNADNGTYTYWYKPTNEEEWKQAEQSKNNTCTIEELKEGETYDIRVMVETSEGSITRETSVHLGELPEGTITFGEVQWKGDGTASITVNTSAEGYRLQYQKNAAQENGWIDINNGGTIDGLTYPSTVYARIFDGTNGSEYASETLEDKIAPVINVTAGGTTSNSVTVSTTATDGQSGMKDSLTYTYSIKVTGENDSTYTTPSNAQNIAANSYTFTGLTQGTNYTVRVQVNGDKADNVGTGTLENQTTSTVGGATGGLQTGNIVASKPTWENGQASITLTTSTGMQIQWQKNGTVEGNWQPITSGSQVTGLNNNDTVYARLTDGNNYGDYASTTIKDTIPPIISNITTSNITTNSITVTVTANDNETGIASYTYTINGGSQANNTTGTHTFTGLSAGTQYTIQVIVTDKAGQIVQKSIQAITEQATVAGSIGTQYTDTTPIKDDLGNMVYIPGGFHIATDSGTSVEQGIVIEDNTANKNQFVWIPVGTYKTSSGSKINELSRRTFTLSGATTVSGDTGIANGPYYYYGEGNSSSVASGQIGEFKISATNHGGFYIGRYEQGTGNVCKAGVTPYMGITRDTAKSLAETIYSGNTSIKATTQLISSYAWDTALNFICQTNSAGYTLATTGSSNYGNIGTNLIRNTGEYSADKYSNIYDFLGNCWEWTTEYYSANGSNCVHRGGRARWIWGFGICSISSL